MQLLNRNLGGRQQVGHIDLMDTISYIEVPERDAGRVMAALDGIRYHGRNVRCNDAEQGRPARKAQRSFGREERSYGRDERSYGREERSYGRDERSYGRDERNYGRDERDYGSAHKPFDKGRAATGEPNGRRKTWAPADPFARFKKQAADFADMEDGWARRRPKKKK